MIKYKLQRFEIVAADDLCFTERECTIQFIKAPYRLQHIDARFDVCLF